MHSKLIEPIPAVLKLADGNLFYGYSIGKRGTSGGEICFNTGMTGYQEIYTDPSYYGQIIVNTNAHIGNYGVHQDESESSIPQIKGVVVNDFSFDYSRKTANQSLHHFLEERGTVGIAGLDTRQLVRHIRKGGAMNAIISTEIENLDQLDIELSKVPPMESLELSSVVTTSNPYELGNSNANYRIAVLDLGVKSSILRNFLDRNCFLKVFPAKTTFEEIVKFSPDGIFISNGPGDPSSMDYAIQTAKEIINARIPLFGICLGHQILALAAGLKTYKMHHGHRGLNHPVKNLETGLSEITSQNHGFVVSSESVEKNTSVKLTHIDLNDHTVEGLRLVEAPAFSVQYHPEASPGPHDSSYLFDQFISQINQKNI